MLERARVVRAGELSRSAVHRLLKAHDISGRPLRGPALDRRFFLHAHTGDLWIGDALQGPMVIAPDGAVRTGDFGLAEPSAAELERRRKLA